MSVVLFFVFNMVAKDSGPVSGLVLPRVKSATPLAILSSEVKGWVWPAARTGAAQEGLEGQAGAWCLSLTGARRGEVCAESVWAERQSLLL